ncbi:enoyl-ACP reductase [Ignatzschineria rhizosphaerae]|uniref:Enoyl-[acyl-carrier-protein] reductase [NADH] n=1 Tax=Ignatzschineria rhizosphaerae TaxID=2923279 RepID=A0ABY3X3D9_9GAMM|nr:enoyl-ACP reductase [Ignatzschineria rhizosphaerae]UNM96214.1 enoyl-ACP reductase [Ignatzschineria rhizosphaerae]
MGFLKGKRALIVGLASNRSIAWGIAKAMREQGAELAFSFHGERLEGRVRDMAAELDSTIVFPCDAGSDTEIDALMDSLKGVWTDGFDILIHSVGFAPREALDGNYLDSVTRENFQIAHDISSYSFAAFAKAARPHLREGASLLTLTYLASERTVQNYNVMGLAKASLEANVRYMAAALGHEGIRVNGISAGPIRTLAASGIAGFKSMLTAFEAAAPIGRCVTIEEVGNVAAFLSSDLASGVTGEITFVDGGFNTVIAGM